VRLFLGIVGGALFGAAVAAAIGAILGFLPVVLVDDNPVDRANDLNRLPFRLAFVACCGLLLGGLAGFASRCSKSGLPFLWCCVIIGGGAIITRFLTEPQMKDISYISLSYLATFVVAVLLAVALAAFGRKPGATS
jgi:hypothetical protein